MTGKTPWVFLIACFPFLLSCGGKIVVASYNVENLFDDRSQGLEYPEYSGSRWSAEQYSRKLSALARAVKAASPRGPDILCLQEVESELALRDLRDRRLNGCGYLYPVFVPQEGVATTVACLSRIPIESTRVHEVGSFDDLPLRHILELQIEYEGSDLYVFVNHWKSKTGGVEPTAGARRQAAAVLTARLREILRSDPDADLLVVGDLNENLDEHARAEGRYRTATVADVVPESVSAPIPKRCTGAAEPDALFTVPAPGRAGLHEGRVVLYDPWYELPPQRRGSSAYRGRWQTPDRMLLSPGLFDGVGFSYAPGSFRVVRAGFLVDSENGLPLRWRHDRRGAGQGTSDHLPILLTLRSR
jgi:endonuclease/exonuclease/phosphatase family metal-dependent hydrolase